MAGGLLDRAVRLARTRGMPRILADTLGQQAQLAAYGDPERAIDLHHEALNVRVEHGLRTFYPDSLDPLAAPSARVDRHDHVLRVLAASERARDALGYPRRLPDERAHEELVAELRAALGDAAFSETWTAGAGLTLDEAVAYVRRARGARSCPAGGWGSLTPTKLSGHCPSGQPATTSHRAG